LSPAGPAFHFGYDFFPPLGLSFPPLRCFCYLQRSSIVDDSVMPERGLKAAVVYHRFDDRQTLFSFFPIQRVLVNSFLSLLFFITMEWCLVGHLGVYAVLSVCVGFRGCVPTCVSARHVKWAHEICLGY